MEGKMKTVSDFTDEFWEVRVTYKGELHNGYGFEKFDHKPSQEEIEKSIEEQRENHISDYTLIWSLYKKKRRVITKEEKLEPWEDV